MRYDKDLRYKISPVPADDSSVQYLDPKMNIRCGIISYTDWTYVVVPADDCTIQVLYCNISHCKRQLFAGLCELTRQVQFELLLTSLVVMSL
jgi:hypothetical protein